MRGPTELDRLRRVDAACTGVAARAEPMLLRGRRGLGAEARICRPRDGVPQHLLQEMDVVGNDACCEVVFHGVKTLQHKRQLPLLPIHDNLKGPEELGDRCLEDLRVLQGLDGHSHSRGLHCPITLWDRMPCEGLAPKGQGRPWDLEARLYVVHDPLGTPSQHRHCCQVLQIPLPCRLCELLHHTSLGPILVHKEHGLRGALLATEGVRVLISLPDHVLDVRGVRAEDLPIETGVLQLHAATEVSAEFFGNVLRTGEEGHPRVAIDEDLIHHRPPAIDQVHVSHGQPHMVHHPEELLHAELHLLIHLASDLVTHENPRQCLQGTDLEREVKRRDNTAPAVWHANARGGLPHMVARNAEGPCEEAHVVARVVLQELSSDRRLPVRLDPGLGRQPLDEAGKEVLHLGLAHLRSALGAGGPKHVVALGLLQRVVQA
mmetsp:Transcript_106226/g.342706  ORF Transcript_106226/g.342706 Transcript_106226/m.342706 type:complete len:433 (+) Transcript_106226:179-1477(+)